jgi:UDP-glucose 4-epimerase
VLPRFVRQALGSEPLTVFGDGTQSRCFTHVQDTVEALVRLNEADAASGNVYNVGSSEETSIVELARRVLDRSGSDSELRFVPYEVAYGEGFEELPSRRPDCARVERLLGWKPIRAVDAMIDDVIAHEREAVGGLYPVG